jgi:hypothetical protein
MASLVSSANLEELFDKIKEKSKAAYIEQCNNGDLLGFERALRQDMDELYNAICGEVLPQSALELQPVLYEKALNIGLSKLQIRPYTIQVGTGHLVEVANYYGCKVSDDYQESQRHSIALYWGLVGKTSPSYYDKVGYCTTICPSYALSNQLLRKFGVEGCISHNRDLMNMLSSFCMDKEEHLVIETSDKLTNKRVVISVDGGRTRTREYTGLMNDLGHASYDTPWCEPKLFVIDVLNDKGRPDIDEKPLYGCRFDEQDFLNLFRRYLSVLDIVNAKSVQIIADGAPWIWLNIKDILIEQGVAETKIVETLDHCHAISYVNDLVKAMPKQVLIEVPNVVPENVPKIVPDPKKEEQKEPIPANCLKQFKEWLWAGKSEKIVKICREIFKEPSQEINRWINYIEKHINRTQYTDFKERNLLCGSGIIESAIRRIINLKYKNASTFWDRTVVEKLYFFRATLLSNRWEILIQNLAKSKFG